MLGRAEGEQRMCKRQMMSSDVPEHCKKGKKAKNINHVWRICQFDPPACPKDPAVLNILRRSKFTTRSKIYYRTAISLLSKKGSHRSKDGGRRKNTTA